LTTSVPIAVRDALREFAGPRGPDYIVVGGVGATWPFATDAAAASGRLWTSGDPPADVSRGAAWWPDRSLAGRWEQASEDLPVPAIRPMEASAPASVVDETPPWLR
jgi:hypothetical protein